MSYILVQLMLIWCLCYSSVVGHSGKNLRKLNKKISDIEKKFLKRVGNLQNRIQAVESSMEGNSDNVKQSGYERSAEELEDFIRTLFDTTIKRQMLDSLRREMETMFAGTFAQEILKELTNRESSSEFDKLEKEIRNIWKGLHIQKTSFRHFRSEIISLLDDKDQLLQTKEQNDKDVCFEARVLKMCLEGNTSMMYKQKEETIETEVDTRDRNGIEVKPSRPDEEAVVGSNSYIPRKLLFAGRGDGENKVFELDLETHERRQTQLSFRSLTSFVYHPGMRRLFYSLLVPTDTLGSVYLNNTSNMKYDVGTDMITNLALDVKLNAMFYTTSYPWSVKVFDIDTKIYSLVKNFPSSQTPVDIALDLHKKRVFVLIRFHTSSTTIVSFNYLGIKDHMLSDLVTRPMSVPFSAIGFSSKMLMYSRNAVLKLRSVKAGSGSVQLPGKVDDIAAWGDTCYIALTNNRGILAVSLTDKYVQKIGSLGIGGRRSLLCLV